jgi:hypothetical protein
MRPKTRLRAGQINGFRRKVNGPARIGAQPFRRMAALHELFMAGRRRPALRRG